MSDRRETLVDGHATIALVPERQRLLRSAYASARYGWPETLATEWSRQPERFGHHEPPCRASRFLDAMTSIEQ